MLAEGAHSPGSVGARVPSPLEGFSKKREKCSPGVGCGRSREGLPLSQACQPLPPSHSYHLLYTYFTYLKAFLFNFR